jgi:hypothetical protein
MGRIVIRRKVGTFIDTVGGRAKYIYTEVEDKSGKWNDDYWTRDGYWVIHDGKQHHIYDEAKFREW